MFLAMENVYDVDIHRAWRTITLLEFKPTSA
jgi:hypothetical protein